MINGATPISVTLRDPINNEETLTIELLHTDQGSMMSSYVEMDNYIKEHPELNSNGPSIASVEFEGRHYFGVVALCKGESK